MICSIIYALKKLESVSVVIAIKQMESRNHSLKLHILIASGSLKFSDLKL